MALLSCLWIVTISYGNDDLSSLLQLAVPIGWGHALLGSPALEVKTEMGRNVVSIRKQVDK